MAYGDYNGPNKPDKGKEGGSCNRARCQSSPALWYNHGSFSWYCQDCRNQIYDAVGRRYWAQDFPNAKHPMFETREMMDARTAKAEPIVSTVDELKGLPPGTYRLKGEAADFVAKQCEPRRS